MLKVRITFVDNENGRKELETVLKDLGNKYDVLNESRIYPGRGNSQYSSIYLDLEAPRK